MKDNYSALLNLMDEEIEKDADEDGFADADIMSFRPTIYNDDELEKSVL